MLQRAPRITQTDLNGRDAEIADIAVRRCGSLLRQPCRPHYLSKRTPSGEDGNERSQRCSPSRHIDPVRATARPL